MKSLSVLPSGKVMNARDMDVSQPEMRLAREMAAQAVFADITRVFGTSFVPDLFEGMRTRPAYLETAWELFKDDLCLESLDGKTKRIIALALTTNETGMYYLAALPHAFRLNALDHATCETLLLTIRFFHVFERYVSGITPAYGPRTSEYVRTYLREEYQSYRGEHWSSHITRLSDPAHLEHLQQPKIPWIGGGLILSALMMPILVVGYLLFR